MARSLAGPAQGSRRPGLEGGGPKTGKVATNPGVGSGPNLGTTRSWSNAARKLEKCGSRQRPAAADDWKNQYLSIISIVLKTACPSTPRSAAPGCLFCRRPLTRRRPAAFRDRPPLPVAPPVAPSRRPLGSSSPPTPTRRLPGPPVSTGCPPPAAPSRRTLGSSSPPTPTRRLPGPPVSTGCPAGRRRLCRLLRRPLLPVGLSGVPLRRRRPAASRGHRFRLVAPPVAPSRRPLGSSSPPTPTRRLPGPPVSTGCPPPAAPSRRTLGSSSPPTPTRRLPGPPVSTGCRAGLFFPPAIPIDPPVSPFAGPPRRTGGVCLPFGRNGGRKCRSRLEYCAEFPSFVTPKHQYHEKPPPRTLCVCGLLQCSAGRMLRA